MSRKRSLVFRILSWFFCTVGAICFILWIGSVWWSASFDTGEAKWFPKTFQNARLRGTSFEGLFLIEVDSDRSGNPVTPDRSGIWVRRVERSGDSSMDGGWRWGSDDYQAQVNLWLCSFRYVDYRAGRLLSMCFSGWVIALFGVTVGLLCLRLSRWYKVGCHRCGYVLAGLGARTVCPECGAERKAADDRKTS